MAELVIVNGERFMVPDATREGKYKDLPFKLREAVPGLSLATYMQWAAMAEQAEWLMARAREKDPGWRWTELPRDPLFTAMKFCERLGLGYRAPILLPECVDGGRPWL